MGEDTLVTELQAGSEDAGVKPVVSRHSRKIVAPTRSYNVNILRALSATTKSDVANTHWTAHDRAAAPDAVGVQERLVARALCHGGLGAAALDVAPVD